MSSSWLPNPWLSKLLLLTLLSAVAASPASAQRRRSPPRIAVVAEGPADVYEQTTRLLAAELAGLLGDGSAGLGFPTSPTHVGDFTLERADALVRQALADRDVDVVVGLGLEVGRAVGAIGTLGKPVFLPYGAPRLQGLPREGNRSGRRNLSYLAGLLDLDAELRRFRDVIRRERTVLVVDQHITSSVDGLERMVQRVAGDAMTVRLVPAGDTAAAIVDSIPADAQAVYLGPLLRLPEAEIQPLIDGLNARNLPTYASEGRSWVERGAFVSLVPAEEQQRRLRRVALNIEAALSGDDPGTFDTQFATRPQLVINMATARAIGVWPRFELMTEAELLGEGQERTGPRLTLTQAAARALEANVELRGQRVDSAIGEQQARAATGSFFPTLDATAQFSWIDPDIASPLINAERQLSGGLQAQQLLFSPAALNAISAQDAFLQSAREGIASAELDVVRSAASAFLTVLRAKTAERINRENLSRIRQNLALAEVRVEIGASGRQDVFRWQSEIADSRAALIQASAVRNQAEIELNRVLNRPLETHVNLDAPEVPDSSLLVDSRVGEYVEDPWSFRVFRQFMVEEATRNSPEIRQLDAAIQAQSAVLSGRRQQLFLPDVFVTAGLSNTFLRGGEGSNDVMGMERPDLTWQVGLGLSLRLFDYTRYANIAENELTISQLAVQREALAQLIAQRVRSALHAAGASRAAVRLRREAAEASTANLELVRDGYSQGSQNVIALVDAQTQALSADLAAADAVYGFLIDWLGVERAAGHFQFRASPQERQAVVRRLSAFAESQRENDEGEAR